MDKDRCRLEHEWVDKMKKVRDEVLIQLGDPDKRSTATFRQQTRRKPADLKKTYVQMPGIACQGSAGRERRQAQDRTHG